MTRREQTAAMPAPIIGDAGAEHDPNADLVGAEITMTDYRRPARPVERTFTVTGTTTWGDGYVEMVAETGEKIIRPAATVRRRLQIDAAS